MRAAFVLATGLGLAACAPPPPPLCEVKHSLVDAEAWALLPLEEDPFRDLAPGPLVQKNADAGIDPASLDGGVALTLCSEEDLEVEALGLEPSLQLSTQYCSWLTVEQPIPFDVQEGERLFMRIWYFAQTSYPAATAELSLSFGDEAPFWSAAVPIPTQSGLLAEEVRAPVSVAAGTPVRWHVGNHGGNSWNLIELSVIREGPCPTDGGA